MRGVASGFPDAVSLVNHSVWAKAPLGFEPFDDDRDYVQLNAPAFDIDVERFERYAARGQWAAALACWRGELLPGLDDEFIDADRRRLLARRDVAQRRLDPDRADDDAADHGGDDEDARSVAVARSVSPYLTRFFGREAEIGARAATARRSQAGARWRAGSG